MAEVMSSAKPAFARGEEIKLIAGEQRNLAARIFEQVSATPTGIFRTYSLSGNHPTRTYEETWRRSAEIAATLSEVGARPSNVAVLLLDDIADFVAGFWACLRGGFMTGGGDFSRGRGLIRRCEGRS